jgi:protein-disulfide isomerase
LGNPAARLVVVEFLDFGCPYCRDSFSAVREVMQRYQDRVYFIARDFPVDELHPRATAAALAARCAQEQGFYWPYHDKLFSQQEHHEAVDLQRYAQEIGLNMSLFETCVFEKRYVDRIQMESADGLRAGVEGTPTFFFNGIKVQGALNARTLDFIVQTFLKQTVAL